ncbi:uncharacterized protein [Coffea arabica]|uniref:Uncharacterized protein n=1 Tax=Coffea arabica TaxID=13443 RepID=A0ABM4X7E3_COFAR
MVKLAKPKTLADVVEAAKLQERNLRALQKIHKAPPYSPNYQKPLLKSPNHSKFPDRTPSYPKLPDKQIPKTYNNHSNTQNQFKRLTPTELNHRREKGLCFKCAEPYTIGHVCKQSHLNLLVMEEEEIPATEEEGEKKGETDVFCDYIEGELENEHIEVSIHALAGGSEHKTIRIKGMIKGKTIIALVDSGSTHCFMDEQVARSLKLETKGEALSVRVANGERLQSRSITKPVTRKMQGYEFQHHFNTLRLGGCDMILGVDWLARYSLMEFDFRGLSMRFKKGKQQVELKGEGNAVQLKLIKGSRLYKWSRKQAYGILAQVSAVEDKKPDTKPTSPEMEELLQRFKDVFQEPQGLPPERSQDHCITLKEGAKPFQMRPYRCPYIQKSEIEKLVQEMLQTRIIQLSSSPFASPVLLVKKKDGS